MNLERTFHQFYKNSLGHLELGCNPIKNKAYRSSRAIAGIIMISCILLLSKDSKAVRDARNIHPTNIHPGKPNFDHKNRTLTLSYRLRQTDNQDEKPSGPIYHQKYKLLTDRQVTALTALLDIDANSGSAAKLSAETFGIAHSIAEGTYFKEETRPVALVRDYVVTQPEKLLLQIDGRSVRSEVSEAGKRILDLTSRAADGTDEMSTAEAIARTMVELELLSNQLQTYGAEGNGSDFDRLFWVDWTGPGRNRSSVSTAEETRLKPAMTALLEMPVTLTDFAEAGSLHMKNAIRDKKKELSSPRDIMPPNVMMFNHAAKHFAKKDEAQQEQEPRDILSSAQKRFNEISTHQSGSMSSQTKRALEYATTCLNYINAVIRRNYDEGELPASLQIDEELKPVAGLADSLADKHAKGKSAKSNFDSSFRNLQHTIAVKASTQ